MFVPGCANESLPKTVLYGRHCCQLIEYGSNCLARGSCNSKCLRHCPVMPVLLSYSGTCDPKIRCDAKCGNMLL